MAYYDSTVACWEAKYYYWTARPNMFDEEITTVIPTYPIPSSRRLHRFGGHGEGPPLSLPTRRAVLQLGRRERRLPSLGGIDFRSATEAGLTLGR